uniref:G_PROTEIN_RECEP_F1_2 domain-containing protein n=1 Tax=Meloidogyne hapla TaxID=6305 RepID=A0A1I8AXX8_MELHA
MRCSAADLWHDDYFTAQQASCLSFTIAAVFCYIAIWIKIRFKKKASSNEDDRKNEILKSLTIIFIFIVIGWIFNMTARTLIHAIFSQPILSYILMNFTDLPLTFIGFANTFILYKCSKDYHRVINKCLFKSTTQTRVIQLNSNQLLNKK